MIILEKSMKAIKRERYYMKNKVIVIREEYDLRDLREALSEGWIVKMVVAQHVSTSVAVATAGGSLRSSAQDSSTVKGDIHYILEKEV